MAEYKWVEVVKDMYYVFGIEDENGKLADIKASVYDNGNKRWRWSVLGEAGNAETKEDAISKVDALLNSPKEI